MAPIPIQSLTLETAPPANSSIRGIITLSWPYSSATKQCAILLADPDFRLRNKRGQVRVRFTGESAEAFAKAHVGIGDEVVLHLQGARWAQDVGTTRTPGKSLEGELLYGRKLRLQVASAQGEVSVQADAPTPPPSPPKAAENGLGVSATPVSKAPQSLRSSLIGVVDGAGVYSSPAFTRRVRLSGDSSFLGSPYDPFSDADIDQHPNKKQRLSFGGVGQWRYAEKSPSPTRDTVSPDAEIDVHHLVPQSIRQGLSIGGMDGAMEEDVDEQLVSQSATTMAPPPLPRLQMPDNTFADAPETELSHRDAGPLTPQLQAVPNSALPLPSPFPTDGTQPPSAGFSLTSPIQPTEEVEAASTPVDGASDFPSPPAEQPQSSSSITTAERQESEEVASSPLLAASTDNAPGQIEGSGIEERVDDGVTVDDDHETSITAQEAIQYPELPSDRSQITLDAKADGSANGLSIYNTAEASQAQRSATDVRPDPVHPRARTPEKKLPSNSNLDGISKTTSSVQSTPQSGREEVMAQTFKSLFGYRKTPDAEVEPEPAHADQLLNFTAEPAPRYSDVSMGWFDSPRISIVDQPTQRQVSISNNAPAEDSASSPAELPERQPSVDFDDRPTKAERAEDETAQAQNYDESYSRPESTIPDDDLYTRPSPAPDVITEADLEDNQQSGVSPVAANDLPVDNSAVREAEPGRRDEAAEEVLFTQDEFELLMANAADIIQLQGDHVDEAWTAFAQAYPRHSAAEWQDFWEGNVRVKFLESPEYEELLEKQREEQELKARRKEERRAARERKQVFLSPPPQTLEAPPAVAPPKASAPEVIELGSSSDAEDVRETEVPAVRNTLDIPAVTAPAAEPVFDSMDVGEDLSSPLPTSQLDQLEQELHENAVPPLEAPSRDDYFPMDSEPTPPVASSPPAPPEPPLQSSSPPQPVQRPHKPFLHFPPERVIEDSQSDQRSGTLSTQPTPTAEAFDVIDVPHREARVLPTVEDKEHPESPGPLVGLEEVIQSQPLVGGDVVPKSESTSKELTPRAELTPEGHRTPRGDFTPREERGSQGEVSPQDDLMSREDLTPRATTRYEKTPPPSMAQAEVIEIGSSSPIEQSAPTSMSPSASVVAGQDAAVVESVPDSGANDGGIFEDFVESEMLASPVHTQQAASSMASVEVEVEASSQVRVGTAESESVSPPPTPAESTLLLRTESSILVSESTASYPVLPPTPLQSQSQQASESLVPDTLEVVTESVLPPTPQLTQIPSEMVAEPKQEPGAIAEIQHEAKAQSELEAIAETKPEAKGETEAEAIKMDTIAPAQEVQEQTVAELLHTTEQNAPAKTPRKVPRKSIRQRLSGVPEVLSTWFSPKRSSGSVSGTPVKPSATTATIEEVAVEDDERPLLSGSGAVVTPKAVLARSPSNGMLTSQGYFTPLSNLEAKLNPSSQNAFGGSGVDILVIVTDSTTEPKKANGGPRHFYTIFRVQDTSQSPDSTTRVEVFRPWKATLPIAEVGDVVLLRAFSVKSKKRQAYLLSTDTSGWCVWRFVEAKAVEDESEKPMWARKHMDLGHGTVREEIKGPPVELGEEERGHAKALRAWWTESHGEATQTETTNGHGDEAMNGTA